MTGLRVPATGLVFGPTRSNPGFDYGRIMASTGTWEAKKNKEEAIWGQQSQVSVFPINRKGTFNCQPPFSGGSS